MQLLPRSPLVRGKRTVKVKVQGLMGWNKDSLKGKEKSVCANTAKPRFIHHLPLAGRFSATSRKAGGPSRVTVYWEDQYCCCSEHPPFISPLSLIPVFYLLSMMPYGMGYPCGQPGSASWLCPVPAPCVHPAPRWQGRSRISPWLCASTALQQLKPVACYHHYFHLKKEIQNMASCKPLQRQVQLIPLNILLEQCSFESFPKHFCTDIPLPLLVINIHTGREV